MSCSTGQEEVTARSYYSDPYIETNEVLTNQADRFSTHDTPTGLLVTSQIPGTRSVSLELDPDLYDFRFIVPRVRVPGQD